MSVKIKLSYTDPAEREHIEGLLKPYILKTWVSKDKKSAYERVYFKLKIPHKNGDSH